MNKLILATAFSLLSLQHAYAEQYGLASSEDNRIQMFKYSPHDVFVINTHLGKATLVQLEDGEYLDDENSALGMGDSDSWSLAVKGNNIVFKPIKEDPSTNIVLVSNRRTYAFELRNNPASLPTYVARFEYPEEVASKANPAPVMPSELQKIGVNIDGQSIWIDAKYNTRYMYKGDQSIKPTSAWNDGRFTYFKYAHASDLPAVYRVLADNSELIVNTHIEGDTLIIQEVSPVYRLRFGKLVGDVANHGVKAPEFNTHATSDDSLIRIDQ